MSSLFENALGTLRQMEAGYVNNPNDSGGETNFGVTVAVARAFGYQGSMRDMPYSTAAAIYKQRYWDSQCLDTVASVLPVLAVDTFTKGVLVGPDVMGAFVQRSLNVLNMKGAWYPDLKVDGRIGPMTVAALSEYLKRRPELGAVVLRRAVNSLLGVHFIELAEAREKDEEFVYGWLAKRVD